MTTDAIKWQFNFFQARAARRWFRYVLLLIVMLAIVAVLYLCARGWFSAPPALQPGDLLLLEPESIARVEAAARAGDVLAQSTLGNTYLDGNKYLPKDVTKAVYWLRKVADRDHSEFDRIPRRMQSLLEQRRYEFDAQKRREMDLEYLDLAAKKLAYEAAFLGLTQVYLGGHGVALANTERAVHYLRLGADYGFPSAQRILGIVTEYGWLGVPKNEIQATLLLNAAAAQGDRVAQRLLVEFRSYHDAVFRARMGAAFSEHSVS